METYEKEIQQGPRVNARELGGVKSRDHNICGTVNSPISKAVSPTFGRRFRLRLSLFRLKRIPPLFYFNMA
jgi:hypothetical protein